MYLNISVLELREVYRQEMLLSVIKQHGRRGNRILTCMHDSRMNILLMLVELVQKLEEQ